MMRTILVVDDDKEIANLVSLYLVNEGYQVLKGQNGLEALQLLAEHEVDLIILDVMMPELDGMEVCRRVRETRTIPILMLSAKAEDMDKVLGLMTGADDYMVKPFNPMELSARVKSLLRRSFQYNSADTKPQTGELLKLHSLEINKSAHTVMVNQQPVSLTNREFDILYLLASHPGRVFSAEDIFQLVWKEQYYAVGNSVMVHICNLRDKLERVLGYKLIQTVWGVGYKIEE
ncbi:response regulator transcription factor [Paenibacillus doosanensis]|uniref:response regulator transcription factor n=1 Tax=Paenibacillus doosanensis TaxID=1229154 RepID=UPI0021805F39|nr:response regulator transcription factor [Paenibacillus doosanensis]MCS7458788.1 response regulator transcription factor [Paenibacillus doosanensis]